MAKLIKLTASPFTPPVEFVEDIVITLHSPYSETSVTVLVNPQIVDWTDTKVGNILVLRGTPDSKTLRFDLAMNSTHRISYSTKVYEIKLMRIGKEKMDGQDFLSYEFFVEQTVHDADFRKEGNITFWARHKNKNWATDNNEYEFWPFGHEGVEVVLTKKADKTLIIELNGPFDRKLKFTCTVPPCDDRGLFVAGTWKDAEINLLLNAIHIKTLAVAEGDLLES